MQPAVAFAAMSRDILFSLSHMGGATWRPGWTCSMTERDTTARRDLRPVWFWLSLCGAAVVFSFGLALWVAVLNGDRALAAGWRFVVACFGGTV